MTSAADDMPALLAEGIELFNRREFFECHEVLEKFWNTQEDPEKQFTQGLIQVAVATYHLGRKNAEGARKLYTRGLERLRPFAPTHRGIDVSALVVRCEALLRQAQANDCSFDPPVISFVRPAAH